jgi:hypothetical protein
MKSKFIIFVAFFMTAICFSQEKIEINNLIKEWNLVTLEKNGTIKRADEFEKEESIIFYKNNKFKMIDSEQAMNGVWKFNYITNVLELTLIELNQKIKLTVLKLNETELDYIAEDIDSKMIFHFKPK